MREILRRKWKRQRQTLRLKQSWYNCRLPQNVLTEFWKNSDEETIARHQATLRAIINKVDNLHLVVEAAKFSSKEDPSEWNSEINDTLLQPDGHVPATKEWLEEN